MKNDFCDLDETKIAELKIPAIAVGLLTSPFQFNVSGAYVHVPTKTFKQFTNVVTAFVLGSQETRPDWFWINEDELPRNLSHEVYDFLFPLSKVIDGVRMFPWPRDFTL